ncbi:uncharacterized protein LOC117226436 [Megalopta genalis]|uniref:uncharacterized protein LOC117226436 n=1 Tax=Megalopta genalis TaxID=115081 RepID=UPI00144312D6|nr:uncharacterized protein LOC117226436 isoform X1 [Megalopta genalis]XP_033336630.1 uncharacterized protein LOC117226436 isoform X2 [Megalopta genalis]
MTATLSVARRFPDCVDWQKMRTVAVWTAFVLAYSSSPLVAGIRFIDPISAQSGNTGDIGEKCMHLTEPTCEELRAMWRYTKRQSNAASYNIRETYSEGVEPPVNYRGGARNRAGGSTPIYGKVVHKVPGGSRLRNGMRHSSKQQNKYLYGEVSHQFSGGSRRPNVRTMVGRFDRLKELLLEDRARELQEQRNAEEMAAKTSGYEYATDNEDQLQMQQHRKQFFKPIFQISSKPHDELGLYAYNMPNIGQAWSRSGPQSREYALR